MATPDDEAFLKKYGNYKPATARVPVSTIRPIIGGESEEAAAARRADEARKVEAEGRAQTGTEINVSSEARSGREEVRKSILDLQTRFRGDENVKKYEGALPNYVAALNTKPTNSGDALLTYHLNKAVDPGSTVGAGDMETMSAADARLPALTQKWLTELRLSNGKFTPEARDGLRLELAELIKQREQAYNSTRAMYGELAQSPEFGVRPELVIGKTPFGESFTPEIEKYWSKRDESGMTPQQLALTAGENFSTEQDKAIAAAVNQTLAQGGGVQELASAAQAAGGQITPDDIANFQRAVEARAQGQAVTFNTRRSGTRSPIAQAAGEALMTPAGTAVTGAVNAAGLGVLSQFAGDQVQGLEALNPTAGMIGEIGGSMLGTAGLAKGAAMGLGAVAPNLAGRLAGGGLAGAAGRELATEAAYGGLYAANTGEDIGTGVALGALGSLGGQAIGAGVRRAAPVVNRMIGRGDVPPDGGVPPMGGGPDGGAPAPQGMAPQAAMPSAGAMPSGGAPEPAIGGTPTGQPATGGTRGTAGAMSTSEETIRAQRALELPVPIELARFQRTRNFAEQQRARELAKNNEVGGPIRERMTQQQEALRQNFERFIDGTGSQVWQNPYEQGGVIADALATLAKRERTKINALYKRADAAGETMQPVGYQDVVTFINEQTPTTREKLAPVLNAVQEQIAKNDPTNSGTITLKAMEDVRKLINRVAQPGTPDAEYGRQMKQIIDTSTEGAGGDIYKRARAARAKYAQDFENIDLVQKVFDNKPNTAERYIALEKVTDRITGTNTPLDSVNHLIGLLDRAGPRGERAKREFQGAVMEKIRDQAYRGITTDESGGTVIQPSALNNIINDLDRTGKLDAIFDKKTAELLRTVNDVTKDIVTAPPGSVNASGTSSAVMNAIDTMATFGTTGIPVPAAKLLNEFRKAMTNRTLRKEVKRLLD